MVHLLMVFIFKIAFACRKRLQLLEEEVCSSLQLAQETREHFSGEWGGRLHVSQEATPLHLLAV